MAAKLKLLVVGGGFAGSHVAKAATAAGFDVTIVDKCVCRLRALMACVEIKMHSMGGGINWDGLMIISMKHESYVPHTRSSAAIQSFYFPLNCCHQKGLLRCEVRITQSCCLS